MCLDINQITVFISLTCDSDAGDRVTVLILLIVWADTTKRGRGEREMGGGVVNRTTKENMNKVVAETQTVYLAKAPVTPPLPSHR